MQAGEQVAMNSCELALYQAGLRRGHAECLKQIAAQLREAAEQQKKIGDDGCEFDERGDVTAKPVIPYELERAYRSFAVQLDAPAEQALKEQQSLIEMFLSMRKPHRAIVDRFRDAVNGALCGWRGQ